ncbi:DUF3558 domain-containing protein [Amycolatopsis minnesotensis]|uniref:DUF3558 domain-containing protein n=1 Tax=Amycolatopsis minnesotensis TaxID=337894 RepID=UPI0031DC87F4
MPYPIRIGAAALAAGALLAGCSGTGGNSGSTSAPASSPQASAPAGDVPRVPSPLPVDKLTSTPCSALSEGQLSQIGIAQPTPGQGAGGPQCVWTSTASDLNHLTISPVTANKNGLSDFYATKARNVYFEPTRINGYPAVFADTDDGRAMGSCGLWVGVTDQLVVDVITQIPSGANKAKSCDFAQRAATLMIDNLKGGAR